jgi:DNA-directed RNA polymerase specialized sigma24 family protein
VTRPGRRTGGWSPEEAAEELHRRRAELIGQLRRRNDGRGVPLAAQEEIVDDAITAVVMSPRGVRNEHHMLGAFWLAVEHRCNRYREGRHSTRLGSRLRVEFDAAVQQATSRANPYEKLELRDRFARAADLMAELDPRERQVVSVMACYGVGPVPAARMLRLPLGEVRSAIRSANAKLDRIAAIAAAGRICQFRERVIAADAAGEANEFDARLARAHVTACAPCGKVYRRLRREMRGREFQRAAAAAFLPMPVAPFGHATGFGKIAVWIEQRVPFLPRGSGERAAEVLGGAGVAKAAVAGTAIVIAGSALTGHIVHAITGEHAPIHHRVGNTAQQAYQPTALAKDWANPISAAVAPQPRISSPSTALPRQRVTTHYGLPVVPSKSDSYLALGTPSSVSSSAPQGSSQETQARVASVASTFAEPTSAPPPTQSGGGTNLGYLGHH